MQYLECLSAALSDMAYTYQPAERMSVVLRAVMVELRGGGETHQLRLYKPKSAVVPARRGSTIDMEETEHMSQVSKKRQTGRPRAGTGASMRKPRTSSMSTTMSMPAEHQGFNIKAPPPPRFDDPDRLNDYIMVTPRSEVGGSWPAFNETPELTHALSTPSTTLSSSNNRHSGAWMGAELDANDSISQLANVHFPEMDAFDGETGGVDGMTNLDFMNLGEGGGDWGMGKEWAAGMGVGSDLDGFPPQSAFNATGASFGTAEKFEM
jgi:hypothetical protein